MSKADKARGTRMGAEEREELEKKIGDRLADHDVRRAADLVIRGYGPEIYGFLVGILRSYEEADEAFSRFTEDLFDGLPGFLRRSSVRTWAYVIARNAATAVLRGHTRAARNEPISGAEDRAELLRTSRSVTTEWRKSSVKDAFRELRRELPEEDQVILILRVDRDLPWRDVARVTGQFDAEPSEEALVREEQRIKKRMKPIVGMLQRLGIERGLITPEQG